MNRICCVTRLTLLGNSGAGYIAFRGRQSQVSVQCVRKLSDKSLRIISQLNLRYVAKFLPERVYSIVPQQPEGGNAKPEQVAGERHDPAASVVQPGVAGNEVKSAEAARLAGLEAGKLKATKTVPTFAEDYFLVSATGAFRDWLLKSSDLEALPKIEKRSPHSGETMMHVYRRSDVERLAYTKYGGKEQFLKAKMELLEREDYERSIIHSMKKAVRAASRDEYGEPRVQTRQLTNTEKSARHVVILAVIINGANVLAKFATWWLTSSHSMFAEMIHSIADTINQLVLYYGIHKSAQLPDSTHPYGYTQMRTVCSLISGVGICCLGAGLSIYHGIHGIINSYPAQPMLWAVAMLFGSSISEGASFWTAFRHTMRSAKQMNVGFLSYVYRGVDPSINVVLLEDTAGLLGVIIAGAAITTTHFTGLAIADSIGSILIGGLLGGVACFIIWRNTQILLGRSIAPKEIDGIMNVVARNPTVRGIYDVKATDIGNNLVRFKAEIDLNGKELTRQYLEHANLEEMVKEFQTVKNVEDAARVMVLHGEKIVDQVGIQINKIEADVKTSYPNVRHIDIEVN